MQQPDMKFLKAVPMTDSRDPRWYRQEAARLREKAAAISDSDELQESYLMLAERYEELAQALEPRR